ncbi:MAG: hypothetical protein D6739_10135 [Nitrospirae bacterium]|nr:MAG: hypothetical protein D6739_10135 [Nitrospirota bacterium]
MTRQEPGPSAPGRSAAWDLLVVRLVLHTLLLSLLLVPYVAPGALLPAPPLARLAPLAAVALLSLGGAAAALRRAQGPALVEVQLATDLLLARWVCGLTGGPVSPYVTLYPLLLAAAVALVPPRHVAAAAGFVVAAYLSSLLPWGYGRGAEVAPVVGITLAALAATGLLARRLARRRRQERDRLHAEARRYHELQTLHRCVVRSIHSGLLTVGPDRVITFANPRALEILGRGGVVGSPLDAFFVLPAETTWEELLSGGRRFECSLAGGGDRVAGLAASPLCDDAGVALGWVVSFQDLTQVKRLEREAQAREQLAAIGELSARLAHEVRNPLGAISGAAQLLAESGAAGGRAARLMGIVVRESARLNRLVEDFLGFARPRPGRPVAVELARLAREVVDLVQADPEVGGVEILAEGDPVAVRLDADAVRQCLLNLIQNAIHAVAAGGRVAVRATWEARDGEVRFEVEDDGCGIPEEELERIFFPFHTGRPDGTGLGLAVVKRLAEACGARVAVASRVGEGSRFTLRWPAEAVEAAPVSG